MLHDVIKIEAPNLYLDEQGLQHIDGTWPEYIGVDVSMFRAKDDGTLSERHVQLTEDTITIITVESVARYEFIDERFYNNQRRARLESVEYGVLV